MKLPGYSNIRSFYDFSGRNPWKTPLHLSIGFHILLITAALVLPSLLRQQPSLPEFYTVNLINVAEVAPQTAPARSAPRKQAESPPAPAPKATASRKPAPVSKEVSVSVPAAPAEVVSLAPAKQKVKLAPPKPEVDIEKAKQAIIREKKRSEQELRRSKEIADAAARDAVAKLREAIRSEDYASTAATAASSSSSTSTTTGTGPASGPAGSGVEMDAVMKNYYAAVYQCIQEHWFLPPLQNWDASLEAIMIIKLRKDGTVIKSYFEKKSTNIYFNQFLEKTILEAAPLPAFPKELRETSLEIGLRFTPAGVF